MDQKVQDDIQELSSSCHYSWLDPIIHVDKDVPNPYLDEKLANLNLDQNFLSNPIGGIYAQNENIISFNDNPITKSDKDDEKKDSNQIQLSSFVIQTQALSTSSQPNIITKFSSSFNLQSQNNLSLIPGFLIRHTIKVCKIEHPSFEFIEPIMFSAFLYSRQTKTIVSEIWNFFPEECTSFLQNYSQDLKNFQSATFEVDPTKNPSLMSYDFIIFASHPVKKDRGQAALNYYSHPDADSAQQYHKINAKYQDQQISTFATFGFAFFDFKGIPQKPESDPLGLQFFKIDRMPAEKEISQLHINVVAKKFEQIDLRIRICKSDTESELLIRQINSRRPLPLMNSINQAVLHIDSLSTPQANDSDSNSPPPIEYGYVIKVECRENNDPIPIIRSNFDPSKYVQSQVTKLCYPPTSSNFNESFLLNLPYPISSSTVLNFTLYKCNFSSGKGKDKAPFTLDIVGSQNISILDGFVDEYSKVLFPGENILAIRLNVISSVYTNNKNLYTFLSSLENPSFSLLQGVPSYQLVTYLHSILSKFIRKLALYNDTDFVDEFIKTCGSILKDANLKVKNNFNVSAEDLSVFLLAFVRFFSFTPYELNEIQNHIASPTPVQSNTETANNQADQKEEGSENNKVIANEEFIKLQFHQKLFVLLTNFLQTHENGVEILSPYLDFFFSLIAKYLYLIKPQQGAFGDEFGLFVLKFISCSSSASNFSQLVCSFAIFINLLYDCGYSGVAVEAVKVLLMNWPEKTDPPNDDEKLIRPKNDFIETLFKPSLFAILVRNSKEFQDIVIGLIKGGYDSISTSPEPCRLFDILFRLSEVFDDNMNQSISSRLVEATNFFQPEHFITKDSILSPCIYFLYLLVNCEKPPSSKKIFDGLHYLLTKVYKQNAMNEALRNASANNAELSPKENPIEGKKRTKKAGTFAIRKKASDLVNFQNLTQATMPTLKDDKETKLFMNYTNKSVFDLIIKLERSDNLQISSIISLIFHLLCVTKELELIEKMIFILNYYMQNFKMEFINATSPALVRILSKLLNLSIISTNKKPESSDQGQQEPASATPASSRVRSRAVSFTAKKFQSMDGQPRIESNEAPENTSFRKESINLGKLEYQKNGDLKSAADKAAAQYASTTFQLNLDPLPNKRLPPIEIEKAQEIASKEAKIENDYLIFKESITSDEAMVKVNTVIGEFINAMFSVDLQCNNNNNRSTVILMRALSSLKDKQITSENISNLLLQHTAGNDDYHTPNEALDACIETYKKINEVCKQIINDQETSYIYEEHCELLFKLFRLYEKSPDAQVDILERLYKLHIKKGFPFEAASVSIVQASIIFENLTVWRKITNYFRLSHPCLVFKENCGICETVQCLAEYKKNPPIVPGFCDSFMFNEQGMVSLLYRALEDCSNGKILKLASMLMDLCWPIFEYWKSYNELQVMFSKFKDIFSSIDDDAEDQDAFADRFFRVTFYGQKLKEMDGKTYIYRQKPLTHLYDFTNIIKSKYADLYGKDNIVQISESGKVDTSKLDLANKVYIQITFVEPYTHGSKEKIGHDDNYTQFFYDTPFVKTDDNNNSVVSKAHQATMDKQWIRKTILTTEFELPSVLIRSEVNPSSIVEKDMEPIKVVCKQIRDRTKQLEKALESNDMMKTQQLLHGSLLVQVNEGPAKIADVFLGDETKNKSKAADKLRDAFILFMRQLRKGVSVHGQLTTQNPEFQPLQDELEAGYESLKNKLTPLCFKSSVKSQFSSFGSVSSQILNINSQSSNLTLNTNDNSSSSSVIDQQQPTKIPSAFYNSNQSIESTEGNTE